MSAFNFDVHYYYGFRVFLPPMTVISKLIALQIQTLEDAGFGYKKIAKQLELKAGTVKKHLRKKKSIAGRIRTKS